MWVGDNRREGSKIRIKKGKQREEGKQGSDKKGKEDNCVCSLVGVCSLF